MSNRRGFHSGHRPDAYLEATPTNAGMYVPPMPNYSMATPPATNPGLSGHQGPLFGTFVAKEYLDSQRVIQALDFAYGGV